MRGDEPAEPSCGKRKDWVKSVTGLHLSVLAPTGFPIDSDAPFSLSQLPLSPIMTNKKVDSQALRFALHELGRMPERHLSQGKAN
jgi:hypothetical protein